MEQEVESKSVDISPITKGKRLLSFLADFFINFIITFVLFNVVVMPIGNLAADSNGREKRNNDAALKQFDILYNNKVMFYEGNEDKYYYNSNVETTLNCYLSYYSFNNDDVVDAHPLYGNKIENETIYHFYKDIRNDLATYVSMIEKFNQEHNCFVIEGENISLVATVKENVRLSFFSPGDMSEEGQKNLNYLQDFFLNTYAEVFKDIEKNDLVYQNDSYLINKEVVTKCEQELQTLLIVASFIAFAVSTIIYFLIIPLFSETNKTIGMMIMKTVRIGTNNLYLLGKGELLLGLVYNLILCAPIVFFMPMTRVAFTYLFNIIPLTSTLFVGLAFWLISFVVTLISSMGQTLTDILSKSVLIKNEDLDAIYRSKGYDI